MNEPTNNPETPVVSRSTAVLETTKNQLVPAVAGESFLPLSLSDAQMERVIQLKSGINLSDVPAVIDYGSSAQNGVVELSKSISNTIKPKELGEIWKILTDTSVALQEFDEKASGGNLFTKLFYSGKKLRATLVADYQQTETLLQWIEKSLDGYVDILTADVGHHQNLAQQNMQAYEELCLHFMAGKLALEEAEQQLAEMTQQFGQEKNFLLQQQLQDKRREVARFEKKLDDIRMSIILSLQIIPQAGLMQGNDYELIEKLKNVKNTSLPAWRNQMVLALWIAHAKQATAFVDTLDKTTNNILTKTSEMLKTGVIDGATANARSFVALETVKTIMTNTMGAVTWVHAALDAAALTRLEASRQLDQQFATFVKQLNFVPAGSQKCLNP